MKRRTQPVRVSTGALTIRCCECTTPAPRLPNPTTPTRKETMKLFAALTTVLLAAGAGTAMANADLANKKNCMACHTVDKKLVGPSYKEVAAKYAGQKDAVDKLAQKVIKGGAGVWGPVPMPPNAQVSEAEAKQLVQWVMTLK
jgi:cytochrome c